MSVTQHRADGSTWMVNELGDWEPLLMPLSDHDDMSGSEVPTDDEVPVDLSGLIVRPGDTLILASASLVTEEWAARVGERFRAALPDLANVVVVDSVTAMAAYRPEG